MNLLTKTREKYLAGFAVLSMLTFSANAEDTNFSSLSEQAGCTEPVYAENSGYTEGSTVQNEGSYMLVKDFLIQIGVMVLPGRMLLEQDFIGARPGR